MHVERLSDEFTVYHLSDTYRLHHFTGPDRGGPHDHPWPFWSTVLAGGYVEEVRGQGEITRRPGDTFEIGADHVHRIVSLLDEDCWTFVERLNVGETDQPWRHY